MSLLSLRCRRYFISITIILLPFQRRSVLIVFHSLSLIVEELLRRTALLQYPGEIKERIDRMFIRYVRHRVGDILMSSYPSVEREKIVSEMLTDKVTQDIIAAYPTYKLPKLQQIIFWLMKHNWQRVLFILFKIRR